ncbi:MAG: hypothetical protein K0S12_1770 [Bacteroidetes bacterium]|jgi:hypothetical protein|nr:hypothetical protein [Bacteroidota bacterium]
MKKFLSILLIAASGAAFAQPGKKDKAPKMAPVTVPGYYLSLKGDTVRGEIQSNPDSELDFYKGFNFKAKGATKVAAISTKKAKGYGFENRHFTLVPYDEQNSVYIEQLATGRLRFYEYKYADSKAGEATVASAYYIQDTQADDKTAELRELKPISTKFYKKELKIYMKDQPITWNDLDKFNFNKDQVVKAIKEFNKYYETPSE